MSDILKDLYTTIEKRKTENEEGSYTAYLFEKGIDKILKKVAEEAGETIIAAKSLEAAFVIPGADPEQGKVAALREAFAGEVADLLYHLVVLESALGVSAEEVEAVLQERSGKTGNLKIQKQVNKNS
ncbi:MAG: phosphoribosyl-ATP diphosphatase [Clostridiales Family XIII bacterium]|jgi:phosphoribosyl-ATP pyrophosphohydrolase|nr:phosphoribosyl-ATP diphosphatase [Clostridiales Family XIII bacterium]